MFLAFNDSNQNNEMTLVQAQHVVKAVALRGEVGIQITVAAHGDMRSKTHTIIGLSLQDFITKLERTNQCLSLNLKEYA